jgi:predicted CopG family antitoxin
MSMGSVNISIKKEVYEFLSSLKTNDRSFSDVILEFKEKKGNKNNIMRFFGALKNKGIDWDKKEKNINMFRNSFRKELGKSFEKTGELK